MNSCDRQYGRDDVDYDSWYSSWMKSLAENHTQDELIAMLSGSRREARNAGQSHLRAIEKAHSMQSNSSRRASTRNVVAACGERVIALRGALEIHELFPEHARQRDAKAPD